MKYIYSGPHHMAEILPVAPPKGIKVAPLFIGWLGDNAAIDLPEDHPVTKSWAAHGWLKPAEADAPKSEAAKPEAAKPAAAPAPATPQTAASPSPAPAAPAASQPASPQPGPTIINPTPAPAGGATN